MIIKEEFVKYKEYDEIILEITKNASETEKKKISEEDELFRKRGWEKYILALVNFFNDIFDEHIETDISFGGSATDSYIIQKATGYTQYMLGDPLRQRSGIILHNDALRIICTVHTDFVKIKEMSEIYNRLQKYLVDYNLHCKYEIVPNVFGGNYGRRKKTSEVFIVSNNEISSECVETVRSEKFGNETEKDRDTLRSLLLIYFNTISGA